MAKKPGPRKESRVNSSQAPDNIILITNLNDSGNQMERATSLLLSLCYCWPEEAFFIDFKSVRFKGVGGGYLLICNAILFNLIFLLNTLCYFAITIETICNISQMPCGKLFY